MYNNDIEKEKELILIIIKNNSETVNKKFVCTRIDTLNFVFFQSPTPRRIFKSSVHNIPSPVIPYHWPHK